MKETVDFKCLKVEEYSAINETIRKEIVVADPDNNSLPSYSASYIESQNDIFLAGDFIEPRLPYFRTLIFTGGGPFGIQTVPSIGNPHGSIEIQ